MTKAPTPVIFLSALSAATLEAPPTSAPACRALWGMDAPAKVPTVGVGLSTNTTNYVIYVSINPRPKHLGFTEFKLYFKTNRSQPFLVLPPDIDECQPGRCHQNAACVNTQGSFICQCQPGYSGNGVHCSSGETFISYLSDKQHTAAVSADFRSRNRTQISFYSRLKLNPLSYFYRIF